MPARSPLSLDPRIDAYIVAVPAYAQPILTTLRDVVHATCPDIVETSKWSRPFFDYRGSPLCFMSAFKAHCGFGFWRGRELAGLPHREGGEGMGHFGRLVSLDDLPPRPELAAFIVAAMRLSDADAKPVRAKPAAKVDLSMPADLATALQASPVAAERFAGFSASAKRDYLEWIVEAKRPQTRALRIATTVEWAAEGKTRHWKYKVPPNRQE